MDRRTFLTQAGIAALWAGVTVKISGCSSDDSPTGDGGSGNGPTDVRGIVGSNHGHSVEITRAEIDAAGAVVLTLSCVGHEHTLSLTADQVTAIGGGTRVQETSSQDDSHTHTVTFN